jgi:hypothetical protein
VVLLWFVEAAAVRLSVAVACLAVEVVRLAVEVVRLAVEVVRLAVEVVRLAVEAVLHLPVRPLAAAAALNYVAFGLSQRHSLAFARQS